MYLVNLVRLEYAFAFYFLFNDAEFDLDSPIKTNGLLC